MIWKLFAIFFSVGISNPKVFQTWSILAIFGVLSPKIILVFAHFEQRFGFRKIDFSKMKGNDL